jgi:hypothetical protein
MTAAIITTNMTTSYVLLLLLMSISMSMLSLFDFRVRALSTNHIAVTSIGDRGGGRRIIGVALDWEGVDWEADWVVAGVDLAAASAAAGARLASPPSEEGADCVVLP